MSDLHYLGEITMFGGNYAPEGWAFCDGALLDINQHTALYSVIATIYGGNGTTNFKLPDLKGRFPVHRGGQFIQGYSGGYSQVQLNVNHMPQHTHTLKAFSEDGTTEAPLNNILADAKSRYPTNVYAPLPADSSKIIDMHEQSIGTAGGTSPIPTVPPFTAINFIICLDGMYPSRS